MELKFEIILSVWVCSVFVNSLNVYAGPQDLTGKVKQIQVIRNVIPDEHYYLASRSEDVRNEIVLNSLSLSEIKKSVEYRVFKDPKNGNFQTGLDELLFFNAELYCRYHGFEYPVGYNLNFVQKNQFKLGEAYQIDWAEDFSPIAELPLAQWSAKGEKVGRYDILKYIEYLLAFYGKPDFIRTMELSSMSKFCPHLFFQKLECIGWFPDQEE